MEPESAKFLTPTSPGTAGLSPPASSTPTTHPNRLSLEIESKPLTAPPTPSVSALPAPSESSKPQASLLPFKEHFIQHIWAEIALFLGTHYKYWLVLGVIFQYVHNIAHNWVYYLEEQRPNLKDMGYEILGELPEDWKWLSEVVFFTLFGIAALFGFSPFVYQYAKPLYTTSIIGRWLLISSGCQVLRIISFISTILPSPAKHCQVGSPDFDPPKDALEIIFRVDAFEGCGDLIFSSHMLFSITTCLCITHYGPGKQKFWIGLKWFSWLWTVLLSFLIIAAQKHYTVDVTVAWYATPLLWIAVDKYYPDLTTEQQAKVVRDFMEKRRGGGAKGRTESADSKLPALQDQKTGTESGSHEAV